MTTRIMAAAIAATVLCSASLPVAFADEPIVTSQHAFRLTKVADGLENPWGLDWLPDGRILVTERPGRIRVVSDTGTSAALKGMPEIVSEFRDGLLDIAVSPNFADDSTIFFAWSKKQDTKRWLEVTSARLNDLSLSDLTTVFSADVKVEKDQGFGSRIRFDADGNLLISVGDHAVRANAQDASNTLGSIIRIKPDGTPVAGNPGGGLHPAIYAYGFKNPQGLTVTKNGTIWAVDHGGSGGGELNHITPGANYGWPVRTFGGGDAPGAAFGGDFKDPVFTWGAAPTVALSGLESYSGTEFPDWQGDLFAGSLTQEALIRVMLNNAGNVIGTEHIVSEEIGRIREVRQGPNGRLYLLNDDPEGGVYRIDPVS